MLQVVPIYFDEDYSMNALSRVKITEAKEDKLRSRPSPNSNSKSAKEDYFKIIHCHC